MEEIFNKTFVATYIGPADTTCVGAFCMKCVLEQYSGHIGMFKYYSNIDSFLLFEEPIDSLNLIEGRDYVIRNKGFLPLDTSKCLLGQYLRWEECKGRVCYQEIVEEYSNPKEEVTNNPDTTESNDKEKLELLLKHGEPENLEDLISLYLYQYRKEFNKARIENMIQSIRQDCVILGIKDE